MRRLPEAFLQVSSLWASSLQCAPADVRFCPDFERGKLLQYANCVEVLREMTNAAPFSVTGALNENAAFVSAAGA
jgi:hypothetical protein